ncbi:MAG TPA: glycosyltransferase family 4 protein [bacterium]|jgi:glycosyltransferase involved in cell wall biosynthesis
MDKPHTNGAQHESPPVDIGKVVMIPGSFPPLPCGVGDSAWELCRELHRSGINIEVIADSGADEAPSDFQIHARIEQWGLRYIGKILKLLDELEPSILHIHYPAKAYGKGLGLPFLPMLLRTRRKRYKIVVTLHEFKISHALRRTASFILIDPADAVVLPCPTELNALIRKHATITEKITATIPSGSVGPSKDDFSEEELNGYRKSAREKWGAGEDDVVLLHYGTPTLSKGIEILYKAIRFLKLEGETPKLVIAGDHRPAEVEFHRKIAAQARGLGVNEQVIFAGRVSDKVIPEIFMGADVGVFPFLDGFSFRRSSLAAALMWDLPIVTTEPDTEIVELYDQEKIKFVERNDPRALATGLIDLVTNRKKLQLIKEAENPLKELYRWKRIGEKYTEVYRKVLEKT